MLEFIAFPEFDEMTWKIIELVIQMAQVRHAIPPDPNAAGVDPDNTIAESINYAKAPPSIQRQMEARAGYQPATEEETKSEQSVRRKDGKSTKDEKPAEGPPPANAE